MSAPATGYTHETDERTKLRNEIKACFQSRREAHANFVTANGPNHWDYWTNRIENAVAKYREFQAQQQRPVDNTTLCPACGHPKNEHDAAIGCLSLSFCDCHEKYTSADYIPEPTDNATLRTRLDALNSEMAENPPMARALVIIDEIAEICNALQRDGVNLGAVEIGNYDF